MAEKIIVRDLKILAISLSDNWTMLERKVLDDCTYHRNLGASPYLLCKSGTVLDRKAREEDIIVINPEFIPNVKLSLKFSKYLESLMTEHRIDLVHGYGLKSTWSISHSLRKLTHIPFIITINQLISHRAGFLNRFFYKRIDSVCTFNEDIRYLAELNLPVKTKKIHNLGAGLDIVKKVVKKDKDKKDLEVSTILSEDLEDLDSIKSYLYSIRPIGDAYKEKGITVIFKIVSLSPWNERVIFNKLKNFLKDIQSEAFVKFESAKHLSELVFKSDVFLSVFDREPFNDYEVMSTLLKIPCVVPRSSTRSILKNKFSLPVYDYSTDDARSLRRSLNVALEKSFKMEEADNEKLEQYSNFNSLDRYLRILNKEYEHLCTKRIRYTKGVLKKSIS